MKKLGMVAAAAALTAGSLYAADGIQVNQHLNISGFIDMTLQDISPDTGTDTRSFAVDQAEIDFNLNLGNGLSATIDVQAGSTASAGSTGFAFDNVELEQARIDYAFGNFNLTLGKFDTFIGFEGLEPVDLYQYSNSLSFELEPTQHTGAALAWDNGIVNLKGALVNSINVQNPDNNDDVTIALHAGYTPLKTVSANLNYATGNEGALAATTDSDLTVLTFDIMWSNYNWTVGFEYADRELEVGAATSEDTAWMLMANYMFNEQFGLTARYSINEDTAGMEITEFSLAPSYAFTPNWSAILEYRTESVDAGYAGTSVGLAGGGAAAAEGDVITLETILSF